MHSVFLHVIPTLPRRDPYVPARAAVPLAHALERVEEGQAVVGEALNKEKVALPAAARVRCGVDRHRGHSAARRPFEGRTGARTEGGWLEWRIDAPRTGCARRPNRRWRLPRASRASRRCSTISSARRSCPFWMVELRTGARRRARQHCQLGADWTCSTSSAISTTMPQVADEHRRCVPLASAAPSWWVPRRRSATSTLRSSSSRRCFEKRVQETRCPKSTRATAASARRATAPPRAWRRRAAASSSRSDPSPLCRRRSR